MDRELRIDAERLQSSVIGAGIGFFIADERRGDDEIHQRREGEVRADDGDVIVGVGDDRGQYASATQGAQRGQNIVKEPVVLVIWHLVELGDIGAAHLARRLWVVGEPGGLQPTAHQLQAEKFPLLRSPVPDWELAVLGGEVILGDAVRFSQGHRIGIDALFARCLRQPLPAWWVQLDQRVIEVKRDEVNWSVRGKCSHGGEGSTSRTEGSPYDEPSNHLPRNRAGYVPSLGVSNPSS